MITLYQSDPLPISSHLQRGAVFEWLGEGVASESDSHTPGRGHRQRRHVVIVLHFLHTGFSHDNLQQ